MNFAYSKYMYVYVIQFTSYYKDKLNTKPLGIMYKDLCKFHLRQLRVAV